MKPEPKTFWFPAKRYGWGWGPPNCWQGWAVIVLYAALLMAGAAVLLPQRDIPAFIAYTIILSALLTLVCWLKGEKPRWRWGGE
ncbi:MAG: hypothetical protein ACRESS_05800 [Stenotrophobium sp.]